MAAKILASLIDGRVVPWFSEEDPIPAKFVVIPDGLYERFKAGEITDGKELARQALADDAEIGTAKMNVAVPKKVAPAGDADPGGVDVESVPQGEPTSSEVIHFPKKGKSARL